MLPTFKYSNSKFDQYLFLNYFRRYGHCDHYGVRSFLRPPPPPPPRVVEFAALFTISASTIPVFCWGRKALTKVCGESQLPIVILEVHFEWHHHGPVLCASC